MRWDRDGRNFLVLVGVSSAVGLWIGTQSHRLPKPAVVPSLGGVSLPRAPHEVDAPAAPTDSFDTPSVAPDITDGRLDSPFCPPPGETDSIRYRHTLKGWLRRVESNDADVMSLVAQVRRGADAALLDALDRRFARTRDPRDAGILWGLRAVVLRELGRPAAAVESLRQAYVAVPTEPSFAIEAALVLRHTPHLDDAIRAFAAYDRLDPQRSLKRTVALLEVDRDLRAEFGHLETDGVTVQYTDDGFDASRARVLAAELSRALDDASRLTGLPRRETLTAVVYPAREELFAATCVRSWTAAVYDGTLRLVVARGSADGVDHKSMRHEAMHAQAIPYAPDAPRWFHEGLADLFAADVAPARPLWKRLVDNGTWIPLASLEGSLTAIEANDAAQLAYAQSLAMVMKLRDDAGEPALRTALEAFHAGRPTVDVLRELRVELEGPPLLDWMRDHLRVR